MEPFRRLCAISNTSSQTRVSEVKWCSAWKVCVCVCEEERRVCGATDSAWGVFVPCACEKELDPCWEAKCPHHVMLMNASRLLPALMSHQIICHLLNVWIHRTVICSYLRNNCTVIVVYYHRCSQIFSRKKKKNPFKEPCKAMILTHEVSDFLQASQLSWRVPVYAETHQWEPRSGWLLRSVLS